MVFSWPRPAIYRRSAGRCPVVKEQVSTVAASISLVTVIIGAGILALPQMPKRCQAAEREEGHVFSLHSQLEALQGFGFQPLYRKGFKGGPKFLSKAAKRIEENISGKFVRNVFAVGDILWVNFVKDEVRNRFQ